MIILYIALDSVMQTALADARAYNLLLWAKVRSYAEPAASHEIRKNGKLNGRAETTGEKCTGCWEIKN